MSGDSRWQGLLPEVLRTFPADLVTAIVLTLLTIVSVTAPGLQETQLRIALGLPFAMFFPGYALTAALFPEAGPRAPTETETSAQGVAAGGINGVERVALSFGLSIAITPLVGLVLNFTPWGITLEPILASVGGFTIVCATVAAYRRLRLPSAARFRVPYRAWFGAARADLFDANTRVDLGLNIVLVVVVLVAVGSVGYAVAVPSHGESFSELYYVTETDDGELVADEYPTEFVQGKAKPLVVGIGNHEHSRTNYTLVIVVQDVESTGLNDSQARVRSQKELGRYTTTLSHNQTEHRQVQIRPTMTGQRLRLQFLLFKGDAPADPTAQAAYRTTHLWINVTAQ